MKTLASLPCALALSLVAGAAQAADLPAPAAVPLPQPMPAPSTPDWRFQATLYGWLTGISGDIGVRDRPPTPVNASFSDVLQNLDGAIMGSFLAQNDRWLILADLVLARLSHDDTFGRHGLIEVDAGLSQTIATGAIGYKLPLGVPNVDIAVTGGVRYVNLSASLNTSIAGIPLALTGSQSEQWLDPTVGLVLQWAITDRWFLNAIADIGGFGAGSQLSSTGYAGLGYKWTSALSSAIGYRYLYEDYENGGFRYNTTMHGPTVSLAWHF